MSRSLNARLSKLEALRQPAAAIVIIHIIEPDGATKQPRRFQTLDGAHEWRRHHDETEDDFEARVMAAARKLGRAVCLLSDDEMSL